jgi:cytochrome c oxidase subunit 2
MAALVETSQQYRKLFDIYVPIALGVFALVIVLMLAFALRYRRRPIEHAARWHEHNPIEGAYALLLLCVVVFLLYETFSAEHQVDTVANRQKPQLIVNVYGSKWEWRFNYPAYGIDRYSGTVGHETFVLPVGEAIRMRLISLDVIHEFWLPVLRYKHDLIAGSVQVVTLALPRAGRFKGQCSELCGLYHARMTFTVEALSPRRFAAWVRAHEQPAGAAGRRGPEAPDSGAGALERVLQ